MVLLCEHGVVEASLLLAKTMPRSSYCQLHLFRVKSKSRLILGGIFCWLTINKATRFVHISFGCCNRHSDPVIG